jgi:sugar phosphate isomerase/epimerase
MGFDGVNVTVRPYPGHVNPENVAKELPPFVNAIRKHGLLVRSITTNIADADSPNAESIVAAASALGITHYWWGTYRYEPGKPIFDQLEALKPRVARIAALSEKYRMTAAYHTYSMPNTVGSVVWDLLYLLKNFDPKFVGFHYDTGHESHHMNGMSELNLRSAGPYVVALAVKDYAPEQNLGLRGQGGPYTGTAPGAPGGRARSTARRRRSPARDRLPAGAPPAAPPGRGDAPGRGAGAGRAAAARQRRWRNMGCRKRLAHATGSARTGSSTCRRSRGVERDSLCGPRRDRRVSNGGARMPRTPHAPASRCSGR